LQRSSVTATQNGSVTVNALENVFSMRIAMALRASDSLAN
jgi:hypothetical protein